MERVKEREKKEKTERERDRRERSVMEHNAADIYAICKLMHSEARLDPRQYPAPNSLSLLPQSGSLFLRCNH